MTPMLAAPLALTLLVQARTISLEEAERSADAQQPQVLQAQADVAAGAARADEARAPVLPQASLTGVYRRTTGNREHKPGSATTVLNQTDTFNWYDFSATSSFILWDFGQTRGRWHAAEERAKAAVQNEQATRNNTRLDVRVAYFHAQAEKALITVAREELENREKHLDQISGFVSAGTRPEIDLAQARADRASARVRLISAETGYGTARAELNRAMGVGGPIDYDVADDTFPPVDVEARPVESLVDDALHARASVAALDSQIQAQELTRKAVRAGFWPTLNLVAAASDTGTNILTTTGVGLNSSAQPKVFTAGLAWNVFAGVTLSWPVFQGLLTTAQVHEADATLAGLQAQRAALAQEIWATVQSAQLGVRAAQEALRETEEQLTAATQRMALADGRYQAGVGSVIELSDAQLGLVTAGAQKVAAQYDLALARAQLLHAIGRR
jgi:outer membrane protein